MEINIEQTGCSCGKDHQVPFKHIKVERGILSQVYEYVDDLNLGKKVLVFADQNTYEVAGRAVCDQLSSHGYEAKSFVYEREGVLVADEYALGEGLIALDYHPDFVISVGSGTITDITRFIASMYKVPFVAVGTAPSMDGYLSTGSPLIDHGIKRTLQGRSPVAFIADIDVLVQSPAVMLQAGVGDLLGKITSRTDWELSYLLNDEYYCAESVRLVDEAVQLAISQINEGAQREAFVETLTRGLILAGVAMAMVGSSRPAGGAEHHLSHFWEINGLKYNRPLPLHGQKVGYGTFLILRVYEKVIERVEAGHDDRLQGIFAKLKKNLISSADYKDILKKAGAVCTYEELNLPREWVESALMEAMYLRDRYTILRFASEKGWLEEITAEIMQEI